jgi:amino acid transporter
MSDPAGAASKTAMTVGRAASLGVGSMVGAGIFALLGEVAAVATSAIWLAFLMGGIVALLNGYSYGRLGARYPSAGGPVEYLTRGYGEGVFSGGLSIFYYAAGVIGMALVARAFGTYAASLFFVGAPGNAVIGALAAALVVGLTLVNLAGSASVGKAEFAIVAAKLAVLAVFIVGGATSIQSNLLADEFTVSSPGGLMASVGVAFFAYTGFGVVTNAAADMASPARDLPRALWTAIGSVMILYVAIALVAFGDLSVADVVADKETALAVAAEPTFGRLGFVVMAVAAMLSTASAVNASLYGSTNVSYVLAKHGELPRQFDRRTWHHAPEGLFITAGFVLVLASLLDLSQVASLGSLAALLVYIAVGAGHVRLRKETGARPWVLVVAVSLTTATLVAFVIRVFVDNPLVLVGGAVVVGVCFGAEALLTRFRTIRADASIS